MRFVLIHGTSHGAWCWERVIPALEKQGHKAIALDLPGHGARVHESPLDFADRSASIVSVLKPGDILVGHSAGGYDITFAADRAPKKVRHLIYLAAGLPMEGRSIKEATHGPPKIDPPDREVLQHLGQDKHGRSVWLNRVGPRAFFYQDCDEETVDWAFSRLTPSASMFPQEIVRLGNFWEANLARSFILCTEDRVMPPSRARHISRRLGVEPLLIDASHSPFLSKPSQLAALLIQAVDTRPTGPLLPD